MLLTETPREATSAGLSLVGTWRHCEALQCFSIIASLLATNTGNLFVEFLMLKSTAVESVQNVEGQLTTSSSLRTNLSNFTDSTAAVSSSLGIDTVFIGESLDFPIRKEQ